MKALKGTLIFTLLTSLFIGELCFAGMKRELSPEQIQILKENIKKDPENINSRRFLSHHYFKKNDLNKVVFYLSPVAESLKIKDLQILVDSYISLGRIREAESIVKITLSDPKVSVRSFLLASHVYAAKIRAQQEKKYRDQAATELFEHLKVAQRSHPQSELIYNVWLDYLAEFVPHYQYEALKVLDDMKTNEVELKDKHYSLICKYNHMSGFSKQAKETCREAIKKNPENPSNYIFLGQTHINSGDKDKGLRMLASLGTKFAESEEALWATANAHYENKNLPEAYEFFKKATLHQDAQPRDWLGYAKVAFELKKYKEALRAFDKHCLITNRLDHEFRRAAGLLKDEPALRDQYRRKMMNCKKR